MKQKLIITAFFFSLGVTAFAQSNKEDVDLIQAKFGKDKKELTRAYMNISSKDSIAFWKLYDQYENQRKALGRERLRLIEQYVDQYDSLDNTKATALVQKTIINDMDYDKLHSVWFRKFSIVIGGKKAAQLFQLEAYLQTKIRLWSMDNIPFIGMLDKQKE